MYVESGLGKVNPYANPEAPELRAIGDGDILLGFRRMMEACAAIGCLELLDGSGQLQVDVPGQARLRPVPHRRGLGGPAGRLGEVPEEACPDRP